MDIHKPKPWRGFREFLKEYAIIVVGVLTALAAEAVVSNLHERRLSAEAREGVRAEIDLDVANVKLRREGQQACLDSRLAEIKAVLDKAAKHQPFTPLSFIGFARFPNIYTQRWDASTAGGRTSLLSIDEQRDFARVYSALIMMGDSLRQERLAWDHLSVLEGQDELSDEEIARAREALSDARFASHDIKGYLVMTKVFAGRIGIHGDARPSMALRLGTPPLCVPTSKTQAEAAAIVNDQVGLP